MVVYGWESQLRGRNTKWGRSAIFGGSQQSFEVAGSLWSQAMLNEVSSFEYYMFSTVAAKIVRF